MRPNGGGGKTFITEINDQDAWSQTYLLLSTRRKNKGKRDEKFVKKMKGKGERQETTMIIMLKRKKKLTTKLQSKRRGVASSSFWVKTNYWLPSNVRRPFRRMNEDFKKKRNKKQ